MIKKIETHLKKTLSSFYFVEKVPREGQLPFKERQLGYYGKKRENF